MRKPAILLTGLLLLALVVGAIGCGGDETTATPTGGPTAAPTSGATATPTATPKPEPITLKLVSSSQPDSIGGLIYQHFAGLMEDYTDGQVMIDIYPGSQLLPVTEEWEAIVTGAVDIMADATYWVSPAVPDVMAFYIDGMWESIEHAYAAMEETELPDIIAQKIEEAGPVKVLTIMPTAVNVSVLNTVRETEYLADLDGLRCESSPGSPTMPLYDYTGMAAVPVAFEEVPAAFIQGLLTAVQYPPFSIVDLGLQETAKHAIVHASMLPTVGMIINRDSWDDIPADLQDIITNEVMPDTYEFGKNLYREKEEAALELIEQNVETFHWTKADDYAAYAAYARNHPVIKVMKLMVDPRIIQIIEEARPSNQ